MAWGKIGASIIWQSNKMVGKCVLSWIINLQNGFDQMELANTDNKVDGK